MHCAKLVSVSNEYNKDGKKPTPWMAAKTRVPSLKSCNYSKA